MAIYHGPRAMFETFDWYMDRFRDHKILECLQKQITRHPYSLAVGGCLQQANPKSVGEIASETSRSEKSVRASLRRLNRRKAVISLRPDLWKADVPSVSS